LKKAGLKDAVRSDQEEGKGAKESSGISLIEKLAMKYTTKPVGMCITLLSLSDLLDMCIHSSG
jgi:hypothetical protein